MAPLTLLQCSPERLELPKGCSEKTERVLKIENSSDLRVAWKARTAALQTYLVQPRAGVLEAGEEVEVKVTFLPDKGESDHRLQFCAHPVDASDVVTRDTWRAFFTDHIENQEIKVLFRAPVVEKQESSLANQMAKEVFSSQKEDEWQDDPSSFQGDSDGFGNEGKAQPEEVSSPTRQMAMNTAAFDRALKKPSVQLDKSASTWVPPPSEGPAKRTESFSKPRADPRIIVSQGDAYAPNDSWREDAPRKRDSGRAPRGKELREANYGGVHMVGLSSKTSGRSSEHDDDDDDDLSTSKRAKTKKNKEEGMHPIMKAVLGALIALLAFNLYVRPLAEGMAGK